MNTPSFHFNGNNSFIPPHLKDDNISIQRFGLKFDAIDYKIIDTNLRKSPNIKMFVSNTIQNPFEEDSMLSFLGNYYNFQNSNLINNSSFTPFILKKDNNNLINEFAESFKSDEIEEINNNNQNKHTIPPLQVSQIISEKASFTQNLIKENKSNYIKIIDINPANIFILNSVKLPFVVIGSINEQETNPHFKNSQIQIQTFKMKRNNLENYERNPPDEHFENENINLNTNTNKNGVTKDKAIENNCVIPNSKSLISANYETNNYDYEKLNVFKEEGFACKICSQIFFNGQALGGHMSRKHTGSSIDYDKKKDVRSKRLHERVVLYLAKAEFYSRINLNYEELKQSKEGKKLLKKRICRATIKKIKEEITEDQIYSFIEKHPFFDKFRLSRKDMNKKEIIEQVKLNEHLYIA